MRNLSVFIELDGKQTYVGRFYEKMCGGLDAR